MSFSMPLWITGRLKFFKDFCLKYIRMIARIPVFGTCLLEIIPHSHCVIIFMGCSPANNGRDNIFKTLTLHIQYFLAFVLLKEKWDKQGYGLHLGIGICSGTAILGNIGFEGRFDYAAIGNVTNTAARLCGAAAGGEILLSGTTLQLLNSQVQVKKKVGLQLKGITQPVEVYKFIGRGCLRVNATFQVQYSEENREELQKGIIKSVSVGGVCLITDSKYEVGHHLILNIELPNKARLDRVIGRVVRVCQVHGGDANAKGQYQLGIEFINVSIDDQGTLHQFISSK